MSPLDARLVELKTTLAQLTTPRPLAEWSEEDGSVLWWCWKEKCGIRGGEPCIDAFWLGEPPYCGTPNDLGFTVEAHTTTRIITQMDQEHDPEPVIHRINAGGWPGYHTHWTPLPKVSQP